MTADDCSVTSRRVFESSQWGHRCQNPSMAQHSPLSALIRSRVSTMIVAGWCVACVVCYPLLFLKYKIYRIYSQPFFTLEFSSECTRNFLRNLTGQHFASSGALTGNHFVRVKVEYTSFPVRALRPFRSFRDNLFCAVGWSVLCARTIW